MTQPPALMTPAQFGEQIGVTRATVYRYIAEGLLIPSHMPNAAVGKNGKRGTRVRLSIDELERFKRSLAQREAS